MTSPVADSLAGAARVAEDVHTTPSASDQKVTIR